MRSARSGATRSTSPTRATWRPHRGRPERAVHRLRARRRSHDRARRRRGLDAHPHRRRRAMGRRLPRPVRAGHLRPLRRRASAGGPQVHPGGHGPPDLERPPGVRRPGQGRATIQPAGRSSVPASTGSSAEAAALDATIDERTAVLPGLELEVRSLGVDGSLAKLHEARTDRPRGRRARAGRAARDSAQASRDTIAAARAELARLEARRLRRSARPPDARPDPHAAAGEPLRACSWSCGRPSASA